MRAGQRRLFDKTVWHRRTQSIEDELLTTGQGVNGGVLWIRPVWHGEGMYDLDSNVAIHHLRRSDRWRMSSNLARERRRSTRVRLKVTIKAQSTAEPVTCEGQTLVVNFRGALISTLAVLRVYMQIGTHAVMTG